MGVRSGKFCDPTVQIKPLANGFTNHLAVKHKLGHLADLLHSLKNEFLTAQEQPGILLKICHHADIIAGSAFNFALDSLVGSLQPIRLTVSKWELHQGDTLTVLVAVPPAHSFSDKLCLALREDSLKYPLVEVALEGCIAPVYPIHGNLNVWRALFPTTPLDSPGPRSLTVDIKDGRHNRFYGTVQLLERNFHVESLWFNEEKSTISGTRKELDAIQDFLSTRTSEQYWDGPLLLPTEGEVTTGYGVRRYYNGKFADRYFHQGIDYGADKGTPVNAPASGRVILIGYEKDGFLLHGNCVGLDHGQGVTSLLMHLSSVCVRKGNIIQAGDMVGTVGDTGLATGPHLHWGLHVHGKAVDPSPWLL